jgi:hypothetical protein
VDRYSVVDLDGLIPAAICGTTALNRLLTGPGPVLWSNSNSASVPFPLQAAPGLSAAGTAVNSSGDVAGTSFNGHNSRAFVTPFGATPVDIHALLGSATDSLALGMNEAGDVVGYVSSSVSVDGLNGWLYSNNALTNLTVTVNAQIAQANQLNSARPPRIVGRCITSHEVYTYDVGVAGSFVNTGIPAVIQGLSINDWGQVAGNQRDGTNFVSFPNGFRSLFWKSGGEIRGINNRGQVVVSNGSTVIQISDPISRSGQNLPPDMWDINSLITSPGWVVTDVFGLDDSGAIIGVGSQSAGAPTGVLLVPNGPRLPHLLHFVRILFGIIDDAPGVIIPGGRVPPPMPPWAGLSAGQRDAVLGLAINAQAELIADQALRMEMQQLSALLVRAASERLSEPSAAARVGASTPSSAEAAPGTPAPMSPLIAEPSKRGT